MSYAVTMTIHSSWDSIDTSEEELRECLHKALAQFMADRIGVGPEHECQAFETFVEIEEDTSQAAATRRFATTHK